METRLAFVHNLPTCTWFRIELEVGGYSKARFKKKIQIWKWSTQIKLASFSTNHKTAFDLFKKY